MNLALINIGNTHTEICSYDLKDYLRLPTSVLQEEALKHIEKFDEFLLASVVPEAAAIIKDLAAIKPVYEFTADCIDSIDFSKIDKKTLGADRLANLYAAQQLMGPSVLVLDCGTCITAELLFDDQFLGGLIMPGRTLQRKALSDYTGQLPEISLSQDLTSIGKDTEEAIRVGIDFMAVNAVQNWCLEMFEKYHELKICFTGGDDYIFCKNAPFDYERSQHLTLEGLRAFALKNELVSKQD